MAKLPSAESMLRRALLGITLVLPCLLGFLTTYVLLVLLLVALAYLVIAGRRTTASTLRLDVTGWWLLGGWLILAVVNTIDSLAAGQPRDIVYAIDFGMLLLYAPLATLYERSARPGNAAIVADLALAGAFLSALFTVGDVLLYHPDRAGFLANNDPIRLGDTTLILGFLALIGMRTHAGWRGLLYLGGPILAGVVGLLTGARSALLVLPVLAIVAAAFLIRRRLVAATIGAAAVALFLLAGTLAITFHDDRVTSIIQLARSAFGGGPVADEATRQRFALYEAGAEAFGDSPVLGAGWHRRMAAVNLHLPPADKALGGLPHLHNEVLNFAVGAGLFGVLAYAVLLLAPVIGVLRSPRDSQFPQRLYGVALLVSSYVLLGLADVMLGFETHTALYVAWAALLLSYCRDAPLGRPGPDAVRTT